MASTQHVIQEAAQHFRVPGKQREATLSVWCQRAAKGSRASAPAVVYVCGATFASEQAVGFPFDGRSWADELAAAGFDVWAFDFAGYGRSDRYPEMFEPPRTAPPLGRAPAAARQLERVVRFVIDQRGGGRVNLVAHSWGTVPTGILAGKEPELVDRLVFFAPIVRRVGAAAHDPAEIGGWYPLSVEAQQQRFVDDVPAGHAPVLLQRHFERWATAYLASDPDSGATSPPSVKTPSGPAADIAAAWSGQLAYDPSRIRAPLCIVRGEWDSLCTDADARWLWGSLARAPLKRDVKLSEGTHLLHLEEGRYALYRETIAFLEKTDSPPPAHDAGSR